MKKTDIHTFTEIMMGLSENYPGAQLTRPGLRLRFKALEKYSIDQVEQAALSLLTSHKYNTLPTVGDMIEAIDKATQHNREVFIQSRREMPTNYLKAEADRGCKICAQVLQERQRLEAA